MKNALRAIELIRVSTPGQMTDDRMGVAQQKARTEMGRRNHGLTVVDTRTVQESGKFILEDTDFQAICRDLEANLADGVLVAEQSRLVRPDTFEGFAVLGKLQSLGKMLWTPDAAIDMTTTAGMTLAGMNGLMSGVELKQIKERTWTAREELRKKGMCSVGGGAIGHGLIWVKPQGKTPGYWKWDESFTPKMIEAYRLLIEEDASYERISILLDVTERTARNLLASPKWLGVRRRSFERLTAEVRVVQNRRTPLKPNEKVRRYRPKTFLAVPEDVDTGLDPIISRETYDRAQRIIEARTGRYKPRKRTSDVLVPGPLIRCECGSGHYHKRTKGKGHGQSRTYCASRHPAFKYRGKRARAEFRPEPCTAHSFRTDHFEAALDVAFDGAVTVALVQQVLHDAAQANKKAPAQARAIDEQLAVLDAELKTYARQLGRRKITEEMFDEFSDEIAQKRRALVASRPEAVTVMYDARKLAIGIVGVFHGFRNLLRADKRELLQRAVKEFTVNNKAELLKVKLSGGFIGSLEGWAKSGNCSPTVSQISPPPDLEIRFEKPIALKAAA